MKDTSTSINNDKVGMVQQTWDYRYICGIIYHNFINKIINLFLRPIHEPA